MTIWQRIKNLFKRGGYNLTTIGQDYSSVFEHPKISFDRREFDRIRNSLRVYAGRYDDVKYINSKGKEKTRKFQYLNMMKEVTRILSGVLFNEQCIVRIDSELDRAQNKDAQNKLSDADEFINQVFNHNKFHKNFSRYLEPMLAGGGLAVRPYFDTETQQIEFAWCMPDTFIPLHSNSNSISECAITSVTTRTEGKDTFYYTLLEFHEWAEGGAYQITNELYRSKDKGKLGRRVPLSEIYEDLEETTTYTGLSRPNFAYLRPNGFNNIHPESPLGLGVCDNALQTLEQINTAYDRLYWEIKQSKRRVIVSDHFLRTDIDSTGRPVQYFDDDEDTFVALKGDMDSQQFQEMVGNIRSSEYIESINKFLATLEMQTGLASGTFTFNGEGVRTATEIVSRDSMTYRTRNSHLTEVEEFIKELIISTLELAQATIKADGQPVYSGNIPTENEISVDFDDGIFNDRHTELDFWQKVKTAGLASDTEIVKRLFDLTDEQAEKWIADIRADEIAKDPYIQSIRQETAHGGPLE